MIKPRWFFLLLLTIPLPSSAVAGNLSKSEKEWLKMVDFLITSEERGIFRKRLQTSFEREQFIKLFWARRDPDLNDGVNTFRDEFMARYDYVQTHFESGNHKIPRDERSYIYILLGEPSRIEPRIDVIIMGPRWRNRYLQHQPELWIFEDPGYDYKKPKLKIQMIPTSTFGDYVAVTDNFSTNWIRRLKYKFVLHPEMDTPPIEVTEAKNFQDVVDATPREKSTKEESAPPEREPGADSESAEPEDNTRETPLAIPTRVDANLNKVKDYPFQPAAGNDLNLTTAWGYFTSGSENGLLLARIGFPLEKMDFTFEKNQYRAPFTMTYQLLDMSGQPVLGDRFETVISIPNRQAIEEKITHYTKDIAVLLESGRYRFKAQTELPGKAKPSFFESEIDIPPLDGESLRATRLTLMDPNVHPSSAKFQIQGKPFAPMLGDKASRDDPLYPVLELTGVPGEDTLDTMQIHAIRNGETVKTWVLYHEERTITAHETVLVHPVLRMQSLSPGDYQLRFEMEMPSGTLLLSECAFTLTD